MAWASARKASVIGVRVKPGATTGDAWQTSAVARDPGSSYASETRQMVRRERLRFDGGGQPGLVVVIVLLVIAAVVVWVSLR